MIRYELRSKEKFIRELPCEDGNSSTQEDEEIVGRDVAINANYDLRWREIKQKDVANDLLGFGSKTTIAESASIGQYRLDQNQISDIGVSEEIDLTDELAELIVSNI